MFPATLALFLALSPAIGRRVAYVVDQLTQNGFTRRQAQSFFRDRRLRTYPQKKMVAREVDWEAYIASLTTPESVQRGQDFLARYRDTFSDAEQRFGVEKEAVAGILRVESNFGTNMGGYITFNVFYSSLLQSTEEKRWKRASENLVSLAAYCKRLHTDCFRIKGSYGGALGPAQFLPHTLELLGADGNGDGVVDAFQIEDAIFSAANFLAQNGWKEDKTEALGKYYGTTEGYPRAVLAYADSLRK